MKYNFKRVTAVGLAALGVGYTLLFVWCFIKTTFDDHMQLASRSAALSTQLDSTERNNRNAVDSCQNHLNVTNETLRGKAELVDSLEKTLVGEQAPQLQQQANIAACINNLAKMNPKIREEINVAQLPMATVDDQGRSVGMFAAHKSYLILLLITTNESEGAFHGYLRCDQDFTMSGNPKLPITSQVTMYGGASPRKISGHEYEVSAPVQGTTWAPARPAYVEVKSDEQVLGTCSFTPQQ